MIFTWESLVPGRVTISPLLLGSHEILGLIGPGGQLYSDRGSISPRTELPGVTETYDTGCTKPHTLISARLIHSMRMNRLSACKEFCGVHSWQIAQDIGVV